MGHTLGSNASGLPGLGIKTNPAHFQTAGNIPFRRQSVKHSLSLSRISRGARDRSNSIEARCLIEALLTVYGCISLRQSHRKLAPPYTVNTRIGSSQTTQDQSVRHPPRVSINRSH
ncbi:uncharacterized protein LOC116846186 [Odontomachus brunneus]|uniref:uncharacterized protein LOC116846186 n=1 Tax=Odontomachus brunneus TaxID=486640 RepID=UPI0013F23EA7|nr:uncharacterized protein LOC116846186 [Odontomachus brunneus]